MRTWKRLVCILACMLLSFTMLGAASTKAPLEIPGHTTDIEKYYYTLYGDELSAVLDSYKKIIKEIRKDADDTWYAESNFGVLTDIDKDGYPELTVLYSPDGDTLMATVACRTEKGKVEVLDVQVCELVGGATGSVALGSYKKEPLIYLIYSNYAGVNRKVGWIGTVSIRGGIDVVHNLASVEDTNAGTKKYEVDLVRDAKKYQKFTDAITKRYSTPGKNGAKSLSDLYRAVENYGK